MKLKRHDTLIDKVKETTVTAEQHEALKKLIDFSQKTITARADFKPSFDNGEIIKSGLECTFNINSLSWHVLKEDDEFAVLVCEEIINAKRFDEKTNDYSKSELRSWLNGEFYQTAFSDIDKQSIVKHNGDYVSLLSAEDFQSDNGKLMLLVNTPTTTDYARALGANSFKLERNYYSYNYSSWLWLKDKRGDGVCCYEIPRNEELDYDCQTRKILLSFNEKPPNSCDGGVVPVIKIRLGLQKNSRNKFQETADILKRECLDNINEYTEYACPCKKGKICTKSGYGVDDYVAWLECDECADKYDIYTGRGHLWELKEIVKKEE